jgi:ferredoxin
MRISVDAQRCSGHARCNAAAPDIYELNDDGYSAIRQLDVPAGMEAAASAGAAVCPEQAITIEGRL